MGNRRAAALATGRPAVPPGHLGGGAGLVDEDQPLRVEFALAVEPRLAPGENVRAFCSEAWPVFLYASTGERDDALGQQVQEIVVA